jgi:predicted dienelactone hydrolase
VRPAGFQGRHHHAGFHPCRTYRQRYARAGSAYRDPRVRAVFAMAPGLVQMLTPESLGNIAIPVAIVSGSADEIIPPAFNAEILARRIPRATLKLFPGAGHFVFIGDCTMVGRLVLRAACRDADGVERDAIHAEAAAMALYFFSTNLR